jgi:hypothetical protein
MSHCTSLLVASCLQCCTNGAALAQETAPDTSPQPRGAEGSAYRLASLNDFYFGKDQELSGAWSLQKHSGVADSWEGLKKVPDFVRRWGASLPTLSAPNRHYRASLALGQTTQTPVDLKRRDLILEDAPYAGALLASVSWYGFNDDAFSGFEFVTGLVGPASGVGRVQKATHKLLGITAPRGWDNQLRNEPIANFSHVRKRKIAKAGAPSDLSFDTALSGRICVGNLITQAGVAIEMRYGRNMPGGFAYIPDPIGFDMTYMAALSPPDPDTASLYGSLVLRASGIARDIFLDGNTFRNSHSVDRKTFVGQAILGLHFEEGNWAARFSLVLPTDTVDTSSATAVEGRGELAAVTIEWRG